MTTEEPVVFSTAIEGFVKSVGERITPQMKGELAALGIDLDSPQVAYPLATWEDGLRRVSAALFPEEEEAMRWRLMGRTFMHGYVQTLIGRAALTMGRVLGPRRTLERMARNFRTAANYIECEAKVIGPQEVELFTYMRAPYVESWRGRSSITLDYRHGVLEGTLEVLGAKNPRVEIIERDLEAQSARYRARWEAA